MAAGKVNRNGFTLIELLVTIAVLVIFSTIAVPGFTNMVKKSRISSAEFLFLSAVNSARVIASKQRSQSKVVFDSDNNEFSVQLINADGDWVEQQVYSEVHESISITGLSFTFTDAGRASSPEEVCFSAAGKQFYYKVYYSGQLRRFEGCPE